jgi:2-phospho-L-lactate guanylyltransferase
VKDFGQAKSRLSALLAPEERQALAEILLSGVLEAVARLPQRIEKRVVTNFEPAIEMAKLRGIAAMVETRQISESQSVDWAGGLLENAGFGAVLRVPLDLPLVETPDLESLLEAPEKGLQGILVPSLDSTGTNAVYRSPPTLFPSRFGPGSLAAHEASLVALGASYLVLWRDSLALDLDDAGDVAALLKTRQDCPAREFLLRIGADQRLAGLTREGA